MKKWFVYVLRSTCDGGYYVGYTHDLEKRLKDHNTGKTRSLRARRPLRLIYIEEFGRRADAKRREKEIKSYKGGEAFKRLIATTN
ncbi:MAG: GIY-YIG nuclease family protein [Candidatus Acidiferrales bacterium]